jgi:hypothetical protein
MTAGLLGFVGNKIVAFGHSAKLQLMERFALDRGDRALRLPPLYASGVE